MMRTGDEKPVRWLAPVLGLTLLLGIAWIYRGVLDHAFVSYDDDRYVTANEMVQRGLTGESFAWAWTATHASNWHPLTWLSHMLDVTLFGLEPGGHHLTSVVLHAGAALLFFVFLLRTSGRPIPSFFAAALFAWHPLRVESVAWVAERKDVLSGLFAFAALGAYASWSEHRGRGRYLGVTLLLALGLMAKPMLVTLPFLFLVLDRWPLQRTESLGARLREKLPWFALAVGSALVTMQAQEASGATKLLSRLPLSVRFENALAAITAYARQFLWPVDLTCLYPHAALRGEEALDALLPAAAIGMLLVLLALGAGWRLRDRAPSLVTGVLWTLGTLVPVIGLVQVGYQAHADRYTYLPFAGLAAGLVFALPRARWTAGLGALALVACAWRAADQVTTWRDSETLWAHALVVEDRNFLAHNNLGGLRARAGDLAAATHHLERSWELFDGVVPEPGEEPDTASAARAFNLGTLYLGAGRTADAAPVLERGHALDPSDLELRAALGVALSGIGRDAEALGHLEAVLTARPDRLEVADSVAWILATSRDDGLRDGARALELARRVTRVAPQANLLATLAAAQAEVGNFARAVELQRQVVQALQGSSRAPMQERLANYRKGLPWRKSP